MGNMLTNGKITLDQLKRWYYAGIPAIDLFARAVGKSSREVQEALRKGEISSQEFFDVLTIGWREGVGGLQKIAGAAKNAGTSWRAAFDNFRARISIGMTEFLQSIDKALTKSGLPTMREMILNFANTIPVSYTHLTLPTIYSV